jgi:hypothetical protein
LPSPPPSLPPLLLPLPLSPPPPPPEITQPQFDDQPPLLTQDAGDATQAIERVATPEALGELL